MLMPRLGRAVARAGPGLRRWLRLGLGQRLGIVLLGRRLGLAFEIKIMQQLAEAARPRRAALFQLLC